MPHRDSSAPPRVLFVCTGNTCRSVLAEYLAKACFAGSVVFESAGVRPQLARDAENAIFTLRKNFAIDATMHQPRDVRSLDLSQYALLIALDKHVAQFLRESGVPESKLATWNVKDPFGSDLTEYDRVAVELRRRILQLKKQHVH